LRIDVPPPHHRIAGQRAQRHSFRRMGSSTPDDRRSSRRNSLPRACSVFIFERSTAMTSRISTPTLPFALDALEPHLSRASVENHFNNHHRRYVDRVNALIQGTPLEGLTIEEIMQRTAGRKVTQELFNNAAQAFNHAFFWSSIKPAGGGRPTGLIAYEIVSGFGGYDAFATKFRQAAQDLFGSGWIWLVLDKGKVKIVTTKDAQTPGLKGKTPLVALDLWEHSYYPDYGPRRAAYVDAFLNGLINWDFVNANVARTKLAKAADRFSVVSEPAQAAAAP